jgi:drug/metabolite transporter (DMT)-like permease
MNAPSTRAGDLFAPVAPWVFVFLTSTGFVMARYATDDSGPLTFVAVRVAIACAVLAVIATLSGSPRPTRSGFLWSGAAGLGLQAVYVSGVFLSIEAGLPAGVSALIGALHPVMTALVGGPLLGERLRIAQWVGIGLGFLGVMAVVVDRLADQRLDVGLGAVGAVSIATAGMSAGTLLHRRKCVGVPLLWGTVAQYASSTVVVGIAAVVVEGIDIAATPSTVLSMIWAVGVLSISAVLTLMWMLNRRAAARVSSLFFLFPALSAVQGAVLFGERLGPLALAGFVTALAGVALTTHRGAT